MTAASRGFAQFDIDWSPVAKAVRWTPARWRRPSVDEAAALKLLRCTPESFRALRALGLEGEPTPDGIRYDAADLRNAGLYSLSGRTEIEMAMRPILVFLQGADQAMFAERRWSFELAAQGPGAIHPPSPEAFGGTLLCVEPASRDDQGRVEVAGGQAVRGEMITRGAPDPVVDPGIALFLKELMASGVRWQYLPEGLKQDPYAAHALGVGNCDTMSTVLCDRLHAAGYAARVFRGWIVGITVVPHSWVEVVDGDGRTKILDPSLLVLASHSSLGSPDFLRKAPGAALSRIAPTRCPLAEPIGLGPDGAPVPVRFSCRPRSVR
jgi:hypothetical protein